MARSASNRRGNPAQERWPWRGDTSVSLAAPSRALRRGEPRLGRSFVKGERNARHAEQALDVRSLLVGKLGPRGYGRLLQRLEKVAPATADTRVDKRPTRRRRRPRKAVAA